MSIEIRNARLTFDTAIAKALTPHAAFDALAILVRNTVGARLFTIMIVDLDAGLQHRAYTSDPEAYPVSGTKPIVHNRWFATVNTDRLPFVANSIEELADVFPDHQTIDALGCQSVVNLPVFLADKLVGTINMLDIAGHYTPDRLALIEAEISIPAKLTLALQHLPSRAHH